MDNKKKPEYETKKLFDTFASRRGHVYPAHEWLANRFPAYVKIMLDLDDEISLEEENPLNLRFKELLNSISDNYLKVNSIVLFGEIHKIFESRID